MHCFVKSVTFQTNLFQSVLPVCAVFAGFAKDFSITVSIKSSSALVLLISLSSDSLSTMRLKSMKPWTWDRYLGFVDLMNYHCKEQKNVRITSEDWALTFTKLSLHICFITIFQLKSISAKFIILYLDSYSKRFGTCHVSSEFA